MYILKSLRDEKLYVGSSADLKRRFHEHADGKVESTKNRRPLKLIYFEAYDDEELAQERERSLKKFSSSYQSLKKRLRLK